MIDEDKFIRWLETRAKKIDSKIHDEKLSVCDEKYFLGQVYLIAEMLGYLSEVEE